MQVFYRFRSEKDYSTIETERSSIPLWELKAEIVSLRRLTLHDCHLLLYIADSPVPAVDNYAAIHGNTYVIVERVPNHIQAPGIKESGERAEEEDTPEGIPTISVQHTAQTKVPPSGYICYRCGQKGHYIQSCPKPPSKSQESGTRLRKATGIPKAFLVPVEDTNTSVLLNEEGQFVRAQPQLKEFSKQFGTQEPESIPPEFMCPSCNQLIFGASKLDCGHILCKSCAGPICVSCGSPTSRITPDTLLQRKIEDFLEYNR